MEATSFSSPSSADRQAEAELAALRRSVRHAFTTLDVRRRKWRTLSGGGKEALTACANAQARLGHAEGPGWPAGLPGSGRGGEGPAAAAVRRGIALQALRERRDAQLAVVPVLSGLEEVVAGMRRAVAELSTRIDAAARALGPERVRTERLVQTETASQLLERATAMADAFGRELQLRRAVAEELTGRGREGAAAQPGWSSAVKLYLSAWVLEPYVEYELFDELLSVLGGDEAPSPRSGGRSTR